MRLTEAEMMNIANAQNSKEPERNTGVGRAEQSEALNDTLTVRKRVEAS